MQAGVEVLECHFMVLVCDVLGTPADQFSETQSRNVVVLLAC